MDARARARLTTRMVLPIEVAYYHLLARKRLRWMRSRYAARSLHDI